MSTSTNILSKCNNHFGNTCGKVCFKDNANTYLIRPSKVDNIISLTMKIIYPSNSNINLLKNENI